mmetsp:Transcript_12360/g.19210  ORF Transcript_12360/g.19210 Transcript_12360/m.19210 type:complete len:111 (-) Transcript_12360:692-1024(-)
MCVVFLSNLWSVFLINYRPYKSKMYSNYMAINESFYSLITMYTLIFTDSQTDLDIKVFGGLVILVSIFILIFANFLMVIVMVYKGKKQMKVEQKRDMFKRAEADIYREEQ